MDISKEKMFRFYDKLIRCLYPKRCPLCDKIIPLNEDYCACSRKDSKKIGEDFCRHCGCETHNCVCDSKNTICLPEIAGVYVYAGKVRADILDLKFNNQKHLAQKLGLAMAERCAGVYSHIDFDVVSFVPMTESSFNIRTYNQSQLLAAQVGKLLFVPTESLFVKSRNTRAQHELGGEERVENVKNSVKIKPGVSVKGKNILICDDVKTTGATLNQCVEALKKGGAKRICCICVAITGFSG